LYLKLFKFHALFHLKIYVEIRKSTYVEKSDFSNEKINKK